MMRSASAWYEIVIFSQKQTPASPMITTHWMMKYMVNTIIAVFLIISYTKKIIWAGRFRLSIRPVLGKRIGINNLHRESAAQWRFIGSDSSAKKWQFAFSVKGLTSRIEIYFMHVTSCGGGKIAIYFRQQPYMGRGGGSDRSLSPLNVVGRFEIKIHFHIFQAVRRQSRYIFTFSER